MLGDVIRSLLAVLTIGVAPGLPWAAWCSRVRQPGEFVAYAAAVAMSTVPVVAIILARVAGTGIELWTAIVAAVVVAGSGLIACQRSGIARGDAAPVLPRPALRFELVGAVVLCTAFALVVAWYDASSVPGWAVVVTGGLIIVAAARSVPSQSESAPPRFLRRWGLTAALAFTALHAYLGVARHDWPELRGSDQYTHVVMAEQMQLRASYDDYLVYPPGFSTLTAMVGRICGLSPLDVYPALAPALLVLAALGSYALAARLWGWGYGVAAALLTGVVLNSSYQSFADGRYPDLFAAFFLMSVFVAALVAFYRGPSLRHGLLAATTGGAVVLYHSVVTLYLAALLAAVGVFGMAFLVARRRWYDARALVALLAALLALSIGYAWDTYDLGASLRGGSDTHDAIRVASGSQPVTGATWLLGVLSPPVVWLGLLGFALLLWGLLRRRDDIEVLIIGTLLVWVVLMYAGSRVEALGFPWRFERDLGAPLAVVGAFAVVTVLRGFRRGGLPQYAAVAVVVVAVTLYASDSIEQTTQARGAVISADVADAGSWLRQHNTGGTIVTTPIFSAGVSNRAMLALGRYTRLQSYRTFRIENPRSLPTGGKQELLDAKEVLDHPTSNRTQRIIDRYDIRFVVLFTPSPAADLASYQANPELFRKVYGNTTMQIYAPVT